MQSKHAQTGLVGIVLFACMSAICDAGAVTLVVDGKSNIFGAGRQIPPDPGGGGGGILPPLYEFPPGSNLLLTFSSVEGEVSCDRLGPAVSGFNGPDGGLFASGTTDILSWEGISGIRHDGATLFLVGVFLDDTLPADPAAERLDFTDATDFAEVFPELGQAFFIGDGLTGTGTGDSQRFHVPAAATRLFLGFADAWAFGDPTSLPGSYDDNAGSLSATFVVVPEPATLILLAIGASLLIRLERRSSPREVG